MNWIILACISAIFSAIAAVWQKKILCSLPALEFSFLVSLVTAIMCFPLLYMVDFTTLSALSLWVLFGKTILTAMAFWFVMLSIQALPISVALPWMVFTPALVAIFGFFILGEALSSREILGVVCILLGTYFLEMEGKIKLFDPFRKILSSRYYGYIFGALILFTITSLLDATLLKKIKMHPYAMTAFQQFFSTIIFLVILLFAKKNPASSFSPREKEPQDMKKSGLWYMFQEHWLSFLGIALVTVIYRYTQISATKLAPAVALVLSIKRTSVFFSTVMGGTILKERNLLQRGIAVLVMLLGATLLARD